VTFGRPVPRSDDNLRRHLTSLIDFVVTGSPHSDYHWGLEQQVVSTNLTEAIEWILNHTAFTEGVPESLTKVQSYTAPVPTAPLALQMDTTTPVQGQDQTGPTTVKKEYQNTVNVSYTKQHDCKGYHRAGWAYVVAGLYENVHSPSADIILDGFVDRTFQWGKDILIDLGTTPYRRPWVGFIHHTHLEKYTEYNLVNLLKEPAFVTSLPHCKALTVLSEYLADWLRPRVSVPVTATTHPTEIVSETFSLDAFFDNPSRGIIQIGGWVRNAYGIYELLVGDTTPLSLQKYALKGKSTDNYFLPPNVRVDDLISGEFKTVRQGSSAFHPDTFHPSVYGNKHIEGLVNHLRDKNASVAVIEQLPDNKYDELLSRNAVFLNLLDASASNTVVECIVRNTPILVNRLPAL
jgi:hypothetical protein